jgi:hypothetical protein
MLNSSQLATMSTSIAELEASRAADLATFLGTKGRHGGNWSGAGITAARALQQHLASNPPDNADPAAGPAWQVMWGRVAAVCAG